MAIIKISRIQHRRGKKVNLPKALNEGELGLTTDTGEMFVGTPSLPQTFERLDGGTWQPIVKSTVEPKRPALNDVWFYTTTGEYFQWDGTQWNNINPTVIQDTVPPNKPDAGTVWYNPNNDTHNYWALLPPYANTQILTEWSPNVERLLAYSYQNRFEDSTGRLRRYVYPTNSSGTEIVRRLQERLDESVSVKSFGAKGNGRSDIENFIAHYQQEKTNNTSVYKELNKKLFEEAYSIRSATLTATNYLNVDETEYVQKSVYFPSGIYYVNMSLFLTHNTTWYGEGKDQSIIVLVDDLPLLDEITNNSNDSYSPQYEFFNSSALVTVDGNLLPEYSGVTQTERNEQLNNALMNQNNTVKNVVISGMTIITERNFYDGVRLINTTDSIFYDCSFKCLEDFNKTNGNYEESDNIAAVIDSYGFDNSASDISFIDCNFYNWNYVSCLTSNVNNTLFYNCNFEKTYRGISVGEQLIDVNNYNSNQVQFKGILSESDQGPKNIVIRNSIFKDILREGLSVWRGYKKVENESPFSDDNTYPNNFQTRRIEWKYYDFVGSVLSESNHYINVGNNDLNLFYNNRDNVVPQYPCIRFYEGTNYNMSTSDVFTRHTWPIYDREKARVYFNINDNNIIFNSQDEPLLSNTINSPTYFAPLEGTRVVLSPTSSVVTVSQQNAPQNPSIHDIWHDSFNDTYYYWNGYKWVELFDKPSESSPTPPQDPELGDVWHNITNDKRFYWTGFWNNVVVTQGSQPSSGNFEDNDVYYDENFDDYYVFNNGSWNIIQNPVVFQQVSEPLYPNILDIWYNTNTGNRFSWKVKWVEMPQQSSAPSNPDINDHYYDTDENAYYFYGNRWQKITVSYAEPDDPILGDKWRDYDGNFYEWDGNDWNQISNPNIIQSQQRPLANQGDIWHNTNKDEFEYALTDEGWHRKTPFGDEVVPETFIWKEVPGVDLSLKSTNIVYMDYNLVKNDNISNTPMPYRSGTLRFMVNLEDVTQLSKDDDYNLLRPNVYYETDGIEFEPYIEEKNGIYFLKLRYRNDGDSTEDAQFYWSIRRWRTKYYIDL